MPETLYLMHPHVKLFHLFFMAFLCLDYGDLSFAELDSSLPHILNSGMLVSLPSSISLTLEKVGVTVILHDFGFHWALYHMALCGNCDVDWPRCTSS